MEDPSDVERSGGEPRPGALPRTALETLQTRLARQPDVAGVIGPREQAAGRAGRRAGRPRRRSRRRRT